MRINSVQDVFVNYNYVTLSAAATLTTAMLLETVDGHLAALRALPDNGNARKLVEIMGRARSQALGQISPVEVRIQLAKLVLWGGAIQAGWL